MDRGFTSYLAPLALFCVMAAVSLLWMAVPAQAQFDSAFAPDEVWEGQTVNLIVTWSGRQPLAGIDVELPTGARLTDAHALRFGRDALGRSMRRLDGGARVLFDQPRQGPIEIVLTVRIDDAGFDLPWRVAGLIRDEDGDIRQTPHDVAGVLLAAPLRQDNDDRALAFADAEGPLLLNQDHVPEVRSGTTFELRFWLRTTGLREVVLSTWAGREGDAYPLELEIGPAGRLFAYRSDGRKHESIASSRPVADGAWHEVVVQSDGRRMTLSVDGREAGSLDAPFGRAEPQPMLALGGRPPASDASEYRPFTGEIDELMISSGGADQARRLQLSFDADLPASHLERGSSRPVYVASTRIRTPAPSALHAALEGRALRLEWDAAADAGGRFRVQRAGSNSSFEDVATIEIEHGVDAMRRFSHLENDAPDGVRYYRIVHVLPDGTQLASRALKVGLAPVEQQSIELLGNFPNPFSTSTTIAFRNEESRNIELSVWDLSGQKVAVLLDEVVSEGTHEVTFSAGDLPSGTYFVRLQTPNRSVSGKMILAR